MLPENCAQQGAVPAKSQRRRRQIFVALCLLGCAFWTAPGQSQDRQTPDASAVQSAQPEEQEKTSVEQPMDILPGITGSELQELRTLSRDDTSETDALDLDAPEKTAAPFRIGIVPRGDTSRYMKRLQAMRSGLGDLLGRPVEILPMTTFSAMIDAQTLRRIDLAFYSASAFVMADRLCRCVEPLIIPLAADGTGSYYAIIVASSNSNIRTIADLNGKRVVASAPDSIGGYRMQMASLISEGVDVHAHFGDVGFVGSGAEALRMVRDGRAEAAFVWSSMNGSQAEGYSRGPLSRLVQQGEVTMDEFVIIWQSKPIAHAPVAILKSLSASDRNAVKTYLMALPESDTETYDLLDAYYGGGYREADLTDFRPISLLASIDIGPPNKAVSAPATPAAPEEEIAVDAERPMPVPRQRPAPPALLVPQ